jgi:hypothetical protein
MSSVIANDSEAEEFLSLLSEICSKQRKVSALLDELVLLLQMPSEDVLRILRELLIPLDQEMDNVNLSIARQLLPASSPAKD